MPDSNEPSTVALTYNGPNEDGVYVAVDGEFLVFPPGEAVDAPEELAKRLLKEQPAVWSSTDRATTKKSVKDKE